MNNTQPELYDADRPVLRPSQFLNERLYIRPEEGCIYYDPVLDIYKMPVIEAIRILAPSLFKKNIRRKWRGDNGRL